MTLDHPLGLLAWLAIPLAWWLLRRADRPREQVVPSLLPFDGVDAAVATPRRRPDVAWWLAFLAILALGVVLAGPRRARPAASIDVLVDSDPWLAATAPGGRTLREHGLERVARVLAGTAWSDAAQRTVVDVPTDDGRAWLAARAARPAARPLLLVTTAAGPWPAGVVALAPGVAPAGNVSLVRGWETPDGVAVLVRSSFEGERAVVVAAGDHVVEERLPGGGSRVVTLPARAADEIRLRAPDGSPWTDALATDDVLSIDAGRAARSVRIEGGAPGGRWRALLAAIGYAVSETGGVAVRIGATGEPVPGPALYLTPSGGAAAFELRQGARVPLDVVGESVVGGAAGPDVLPAPRTHLTVPARVSGGLPVWQDAHGALVAVSEPSAAAPWAAVAVDPDGRASTWHTDPSFPALLAALLDELRGPAAAARRPAPTGVTTGPPDAAVLDEVLRWGDARDERRDRTADLGGVFAAAAVLLLGGATTLARGRRRPRSDAA